MSVRTGVGRTTSTIRGIAIAGAAALIATAALAGCSSSDGTTATDQIVLGEGQDLGDFNPMLGYGQLGVSPIYDGLLSPAADGDDRVPDLVASLAESEPERVGPRTWRVPLRSGVTFSDGTAFDSADVVATYGAVVDPQVASDISTDFAPIVAIEADGPQAVTVRMNTEADPSPYLLLGIVPSEKVEAKPAAEWALNTAPVGTGAYVLDSLEPDQAVLVAREGYWGEQPSVTRLVYSHVPDDNTRAQRITTGEIDGANLPPRAAESLAGRDGIDVVAVKSADWRGVSLPSANAFTADPAARRAMNLGVDRRAVVDDVLIGKGEAASTPIASVYGEEVYDQGAQFPFDTDAAAAALDAAGWRIGDDGVRARGADRASFPLLYNAEDTLRRDLAVAFAAQMKAIGVEVLTRGTSWDEIETKMTSAGVLLGGGATPYSIDSQVYDTLHTRVPDSSPYSNPGNFTAPGLDALLDEARESAPGPENDARYKRIQQIYEQQPSYVFLAFLHHTYASRSAGWQHDAPILEPHSHGVSWGPWWNMPSWRQQG
ncbi:ABC transporter substrate-binding protein [Gordonia sp. JH63]|uniref:ABC transporter substrate-binding protein n=1 Tax=Gordonia hongkongensis TaxID=1701090 RepID=A0AAX3T632_9ACTN|nr:MULTISPECIES: ABC transporter substrate-binding protein [Gordonia]QIK46361.1 ABC transporter substrate-binding protein [Gordonia terrae]KSU57500.1 ABC transporter substrate-binding protein [Gordonia sp. SGD-V-85]QHD87601.1 ABC transporter substrate-binding protein [Gordonia sp. JH63]WFP24651.1 ABC transporter substrate-binding protein [Gordonia hongkongensis]SCC36774.1 peptide/nickel transport system substrate-binding protein [Gordonia sp. v-85]